MSVPGRVLTVATLAATVVLTPGAAPASPHATPYPSVAPVTRTPLDSRALAAAERGPVDVVVTFDPNPVTSRLSPLTRPEAGRSGRLAAGRLAALGYTLLKRTSLAAAGPRTRTVRDFDNLPVQVMRVTSPSDLAALSNSPGVLSVRLPARRHPVSTAANLSLINQPVVLERGHRGAGVQVAVVDTGADYRLPGAREAFGDCSHGPGTGTCRIARYTDIPRAGALDVDPQRHGTNVTGIVASVAPGARLAVYNVFSAPTRGSLGAWDTDILAALNDVARRAASENIRAVNLSLGSNNAHTSPCTASVYTPVFQGLRALGVVPVVAAGNAALGSGGRFRSGVAEPACAPGALRVGAVYARTSSATSWGSAARCTDPAPRPDAVACFSQTGPLLNLLAPGVSVTAAGVTMSGTSQATPHVTGAVADLVSARPDATPDLLQQALTSTGKLVRDERDGTTVRRLDLAAATRAASEGVTVSASPSGTVGAAMVTLSGIAPRGSTVRLLGKPLGAGDGAYTTLRVLSVPSGSFHTSVPLTRSMTFRARTGSALSLTRSVTVTSTAAFSQDRALGKGRYLLRGNGGPNGARGTLTFYQSTSSGLRRIGAVRTNTHGVGYLVWSTSRGFKQVRAYYTTPGCAPSAAARRTIRVT